MRQINLRGSAAALMFLMLTALIAGCPQSGSGAAPATDQNSANGGAASEGANAGSSADTGNSPGALQAQLDTLIAEAKLPGAAAVTLKDGKVDSAVAGVRKKGGNDPVLASDRFHIGSNTKAFTATLIALYVDEGLLSWDTTLAEGFPELAAGMAPAFREATLRELLTHRAGVPAFTAGAEYRGLPEFSGDTEARRLAFSKHVLSRKPAGKRGDYLYSNAGYSVAAAMLEEATGSDYEALMQERLLGPLAIDAVWGWPARNGTAAPWGHGGGLLGLTPNDPDGDYHLEDYINPAGGLSMSMQDYAKFLALHLSVLRAEELPAPFTLQALTSTHEASGDYSLGWLEQQLDGQPMSAHEGSAGTFHIIAAIVPGSNYAVAIVTNAGGDKQAKAVRDMVLALAREGSNDGTGH